MAPSSRGLIASRGTILKIIGAISTFLDGTDRKCDHACSRAVADVGPAIRTAMKAIVKRPMMTEETVGCATIC